MVQGYIFCIPVFHHLVLVGYQQIMWIDVENPNNEDCTSGNACNLKLKNNAGNSITTNTYMTDNSHFSFDVDGNFWWGGCVALDKAESLITQLCNWGSDENYAFCEVSCVEGNTLKNSANACLKNKLCLILSVGQ